MAIIRMIFAYVLAVFQILTPYTQFVFHGGIKNYFEDWSADRAYTRDYAVELEKKPGSDFKVLNFTDIQLNDGNVFGEEGKFSEALVKKCIEEVKPDLITLTGDNSSSDIGYIHWAEFFDSFGIPWAPVFGNHDGNNGKKVKEGWDSYILANSEYCLFKFGPSEMGYGNYVINVTENGRIIHTLFMMDSHSGAGDTDYGFINCGMNEDGTANAGYDHLWAKQLKWYEWAVNGTKALAGKNVESSCFMHIPVYEMRDAKALMCEETKTADGQTIYAVKAQYAPESFGAFYEGICSPEGNNGFFELARRLGSTKNMIFGHDHVNSASLVYKGIRISYGLKSGHGSYWNSDLQGGSVLTIGSDGHASFSHHYYTEG